MTEYNLRKADGRNEDLIRGLQEDSSRLYDIESVRYNIDNCECPECPCCDPDMKFLWPVGSAVLAASTAILIPTVAK